MNEDAPAERRPARRPERRRGAETARREADADAPSAEQAARRGARRGAGSVGHGHGHGHGPAGPSSSRVRLLLAVLLVPAALATVLGVLLLYPFGEQPRSESDLGFFQQPVNGEVVSAAVGSCQSGAEQASPDIGTNPDESECQVLEVRLDDGEAAGQTIGQVIAFEPSTPTFEQGDQVVLSYAGAEPTEPTSYRIVDFQRGGSLLWLAVLFAASVLLLARWKGLTALAGLAVSFGVLTTFIMPAILAGENAVTVAVVGAGLIMFVVLYLTHGISARTSAAVLGTLLSLALIAGLGILFAELTHLTGLDEETVNLITILGTDVDARGLLLAGVIIGALGVLDDMTISQTSAVWELRKANPSMGWRALYAAGVRIGRDHISAAVNTLALAYAGAALPLLLAYSLSGVDLSTLVGAQVVAQEIVRTLVGSIGLVAAVPITTALAALVITREPPGRAGTAEYDGPDDPDGRDAADPDEDAAADDGADAAPRPDSARPTAASGGARQTRGAGRTATVRPERPGTRSRTTAPPAEAPTAGPSDTPPRGAVSREAAGPQAASRGRAADDGGAGAADEPPPREGRPRPDRGRRAGPPETGADPRSAAAAGEPAQQSRDTTTRRPQRPRRPPPDGAPR
ncbi:MULTISPECIES: YibE/F family protein [Actinoalloteichus]|uniref:Multitransmembrane protein n=1 Tax=Actinoalloteichus fjordicus TaxID=1612552 RepID=A0AAC9LAC8_9PSEU|nr:MULTISPECIES: YibE/F family protein [Actinoalloteichus]APU14283.1 putative multitransmembrane protein [Actinoalloteichus fjordicus]APU20253.1 putative multitransmembrane protein [Actinoalloteichus sp. GBA129-24]